jgi:hypothetical protein
VRAVKHLFGVPPTGLLVTIPGIQRWRGLASPGLLPVALGAVCVLAGLSGCATIVSGSAQKVTVDTDPPGAACVFRRGGSVIGMVSPTPGTLSVDKSRDDIEVRCTKQGYLDNVGVVGSRFQGMTFGNVLFGGLIGVIVDAQSGATAEYQPQVTLRLVPSRFADVSARDAFFDQLRSEFLGEAEKVRERIRKLCRDPECQRQLEAADREQVRGVARIEEQRAAALIGG